MKIELFIFDLQIIISTIQRSPKTSFIFCKNRPTISIIELILLFLFNLAFLEYAHIPMAFLNG